MIVNELRSPFQGSHFDETDEIIKKLSEVEGKAKKLKITPVEQYAALAIGKRISNIDQ